MPRRCVLLILWVVGGLWAPAAAAQQTELRLRIEPGYSGLDGTIRPGSWTPIRLSVDHLAADDRDVRFQWEHRDEDGDLVIAERLVTVARQRDDQPVWLYAAPPTTTDATTTWNLRAIDDATGELLASLAVQPQNDLLLRDGESLIAVTSAQDLGLTDFTRHETGHAPVRLVRGLSLGRLPDRWHGLSSLKALIWTQDLGGDPADPLQVPEAALLALRQWVVRGGHLVVVLPEAGQTWTSSPLADLLPVTAAQLRPVTSDTWARLEWFGGRRSTAIAPLTVTTFDVPPEATGVAVVQRDLEGRPIVVSRRVGFGAVTVVGLDLTAGAVRETQVQYTNPQRLWHHVFGWRYPAMTQAAADRAEEANRLVPSSRLERFAGGRIDLGGFVASRTAMTGTIGALLLGAIFLFGLYWLTAGWLVQPVLKAKGLGRRAWVGFVALVLVFAGLSWGGAALLRPTGKGVQHFTVLDYDGNTGLARARAFASVFVPRFGVSELAVASGPVAALPEPAGNLVSSPGFDAAADAAFIDPQRYAVDASSPDTAAVPVRSTSKRLRLDYLGPVDEAGAGLERPFGVAAGGGITLDADGWPTGGLTHTLPGTLTNVRVVFCPGEAFGVDGVRRPQVPRVWSPVDAAGQNRWAPGEALVLAGRPASYEDLTAAFRGWEELPAEREWKREGLLGRRMDEQRGPGEFAAGPADRSVVARQVEMLSFFDALPPPDTKRDGNDPGNPGNPGNTGIDTTTGRLFGRRLGTDLDLTHLTTGRRLIVLGQLVDAPLPLPLTVDGRSTESNGMTVLRWVYDF
ncbi:MAG: hypothetical protein AAF710_12215 [Planctomycetota bacterium]